MKRLIRTLTVLLAIVAAGTAHATTMDVLLNGGSITAGDKRFDSWTNSYYDSSDGRTFNPANIDVEPLNDGGLDPGPGLRFTVSNDELSVTGDGSYAYVDLMFGFRVTVLDPTLQIKDNTLKYTSGGAALAFLGDDFYDLGSYVRETIGTATGLDDLGVKDIQFSDASWPEGVVTKLSDSASFAPHGEIWVTKNILVWAVDDTDTASLYRFEQRFSQTNVIPEPSTVGLMALGLAGLAAARFRKKV